MPVQQTLFKREVNMKELLVVNLRLLPHYQGLDIPAYQTKQAAGMDLPAAVEEDVILPAGGFCLIPTGLAIELPEGYEAQVRPRSGLAAKNGIGLLNSPGTIDADYRGEIKVILFNFNKVDFTITRGMRIAQLVVAPIMQYQWRIAEALSDSERGTGGFGHTGS